MEREVLDAVHAVKVVFRILTKVYPSIRNVFKGSVVRKIASFLPLHPAPRIHINIPLCSTPYESFYEDNYLPSMRREFSTLFGSVMSPQLSSTPETQRAKIQNLEKQLLQLQQQVAKIILQIPTSDYDSQHTMVNTWLSSNERVLSPYEHVQQLPPVPAPSQSQQPSLPPPPPPPPMPPQNFLTPKPKPVLLCTPSKRYGNVDKAKKSPATLLSDVIQEIARERPALRPVKRSPGGNPLKTPKKHFDDPSDILSQVLRKRFSALHSDSLTDTCDNNISMSSLHSPVFSCTSSPASAV